MSDQHYLNKPAVGSLLAGSNHPLESATADARISLYDWYTRHRLYADGSLDTSVSVPLSHVNDTARWADVRLRMQDPGLRAVQSGFGESALSGEGETYTEDSENSIKRLRDWALAMEVAIGNALRTPHKFLSCDERKAATSIDNAATNVDTWPMGSEGAQNSSDMEATFFEYQYKSITKQEAEAERQSSLLDDLYGSFKSLDVYVDVAPRHRVDSDHPTACTAFYMIFEKSNYNTQQRLKIEPKPHDVDEEKLNGSLIRRGYHLHSDPTKWRYAVEEALEDQGILRYCEFHSLDGILPIWTRAQAPNTCLLMSVSPLAEGAIFTKSGAVEDAEASLQTDLPQSVKADTDDARQSTEISPLLSKGDKGEGERSAANAPTSSCLSSGKRRAEHFTSTGPSSGVHFDSEAIRRQMEALRAWRSRSI